MDFLKTLKSLDPTKLQSVFTEPARTAAGLERKQRVHARTVRRRLYADCRKTDAARQALDRLPRVDESMHLIVAGEFDLVDVIPRLIELAGKPAKALTIGTLGFHDRALSILCGLLDSGRIEALTVVASCYFRSVDTELWSRAHAAFTSRGQTLVAARNHAKLQLYDFGARKVVVESSANLRSCRNSEQVTITADPQLYRFHLAWLTELLTAAQAEEGKS